MKNKTAFTLAEILIALAVIGVIAAITVPALIQNTQKQEYVSALQKAYSTLSQVTNQIIAENGSPKGDEGWAKSNEHIYQLFLKYLSSIKTCEGNEGCFNQLNKSGYKQLNGTRNANWNRETYQRKFIFADGMQGLIFAADNLCEISNWGTENLCGAFLIDVNGEKQPNTIGRDVFFFAIKENGLYPMGCDNEEDKCDDKHQGWSCACKVLREGAINY